MDTIKFADGETRECSFLSTIPDGNTNTAFIALPDVDFATATAIFANPGKTARMEYGDYILVDYTNLVMIGVQPYGIQAVIKGGHDERRS